MVRRAKKTALLWGCAAAAVLALMSQQPVHAFGFFGGGQQEVEHDHDHDDHIDFYDGASGA